MTLTQVAIITRRTILGFAILVVIGTISFIGYQIWYANYLASLPPPEEKPDVKFGTLPQPNFLPSRVSSSNFSYQVATETGGLPDFGKIAKVYFMPKAVATFLAQDKASTLASKFNIDTPPEASAENIYKFQKDRILTIELDNGNFVYQSNATPSSQFNLADSESIISNLRNVLLSLGILKEELRDSPGKIEGSKILIWPKDIDSKPVVTANFTTSLVKAEANFPASLPEHYSLINFIFWPVDITTFSTYPIKSANEAFEDLKTGQGVVVIEPRNPQVSITKAYLAYLQSESYSPYLQPIFVFEAPNFVAYVAAITNEFLSPATKN